MIVISGALVLVALVLLVLGLTMQDLNFVYGSIAVSLVSFVFLVIGILQRRGEQPAPAAAGPEVRDDSAASAAPSPEPAAAAAPAAAARTATLRRPAAVAEPEEPEDDEVEEGGGAVLVVPGRPRYHVDGCRYLTGKEAEEVDVLDARAEGFTACGVCKPDAALEGQDDDVVDTGVPGAEEPEPVPASRGRGSRRVAQADPEPAPVPAPRARKASTPAAAPAGSPAGKAPAKAPAKKAAAKRTAPAAAPAEEAAPAKARRAGKVVVIPDRGRFHTADCRFVRGVDGTEELTRTQATRQGYQACGVCKPA